MRALSNIDMLGRFTSRGASEADQDVRVAALYAQVNYNLMAVNAFMAMTGLYQLQRKLRHDYAEPKGIVHEEKAQ